MSEDLKPKKRPSRKTMKMAKGKQPKFNGKKLLSKELKTIEKAFKKASSLLNKM